MKPNTSQTNERQDPTAFSAPLNGAMAEAVERSASAFGKNMRTFQQESARFVTAVLA